MFPVIKKNEETNYYKRTLLHYNIIMFTKKLKKKIS